MGGGQGVMGSRDSRGQGVVGIWEGVKGAVGVWGRGGKGWVGGG